MEVRAKAPCRPGPPRSCALCRAWPCRGSRQGALPFSSAPCPPRPPGLPGAPTCSRGTHWSIYLGRKAPRLNGPGCCLKEPLCCPSDCLAPGPGPLWKDKADTHNNPTTISSHPFLLFHCYCYLSDTPAPWACYLR